MLAQARAKGVYRNLICCDLTVRIGHADASYDAGVCIGRLEEFNYMTELDRPGWPLVAAKR